LGRLLTGHESVVAGQTAAEVLRWIVPAGAAYLFAGLAASSLAALDDYGTAAAGYAVASAAGLALIVARVDSDGILAVARRIAWASGIAVAVPLVGLGVRAVRTGMPRAAVRPVGQPLGARLRGFAVSAALPIALQLLYVVSLPFAARLGTGAATTFVY